MIIEPSSADELLLLDRLKEIGADTSSHPENYRDCIINKPWGYEWELFDDCKHAVWMLNLTANRATSLHCHQHKSACLIPLTGEITVITLADRILVKPMDSVTFLPKAFHCLWNHGYSDVKVIEIETPSCKLDLIRANDAYGRANSGYEGESHIVRENLEQYGYGRIGEDETIHRFGHDISIDQGGVRIREAVHG